MMEIKKYIKYIGNIVALLSIIFVVWAMIRLNIDFGKIQSMSGFCVVSGMGTIMCILTVYAMAYAWKMILAYLSNQTVNSFQTGKIYAKANIGKYMPGNVMHYIERNLFATNLGLSQLDVAISSAIEVIGIIFVAVLLSIIFVYKEFVTMIQRYVSLKTGIIITVIIIIGIILVVFISTRSVKIQEMLKRILNIRFIPLVIKLFIIYALVLSSQGFLLMLICREVLQFELSMQQSMMMIAYYMLAWVIGFVVPGAPGGIGVREMIIVMLMNGIVGEDVILVAALIHRMISILGDVLSYVLSLMLRRKNIEVDNIAKT